MLAPFTVKASTPFLPPALRRTAKPIAVSFTWSKSERTIARKRKPILASVWAERYRILTTKDSDRSGPWKNSTTPYLTGIMDACFFPSVREMTVCAPPQTGKSESTNNIVGKIIDRDPGPVLYVYPNEKDAKKNIKRRVLRMIQAAPRLRQYLTGLKDDESAALINLKHMLVRAGWSGSPQSLASSPERYVILEEIDKYVDRNASRETSSVNLAMLRARTFRGREKIIKISTPTKENIGIWKELMEVAVIFEYAVRCPDCGGYQVMLFGNKNTRHGLKWPEGERDPNVVEARSLARYHCEHCDSVWDDYKRDRAVALGHWRAKEQSSQRSAVSDQQPENRNSKPETRNSKPETRNSKPETQNQLELFRYLEKHRPKKIGFQYNAMISTFVSLSEYAAAFLKGLTSKNDLKNFHNAYEAVCWTEYEGKKKASEELLKLCDERPEKIVPPWAAILLITADVQKHGIWYEIRAWDVQGMTSALVRYGYLAKGIWSGEEGMTEDFAALSIIAQETYLTAAGAEFPVRFGLVDSGYRTSEVYEFCKKIVFLSPSKGHDHRTKDVSYTNIDTYPGTSKIIPGGIQLVHVDVTIFKTKLEGKLAINSGDPGAWLLHAGTDPDYARQYSSEYWDEEKGLYLQIGNRDNHLWDCGVLQLAAIKIVERQGILARIRAAREDEAAHQAHEFKPAEKDEEDFAPTVNYQRPSWLDRR